jgi:hypothetical protein
MEALAKLIEYGESRPDRPLTIFFFGDHLPALGNMYGFYRETGVVRSAKSSEWSPKEMLRMRTTTYVAYSNVRKFTLGGQTSALFAGRQLGDWLGLPDTPLDVSNRRLEQDYLALIPGLEVNRGRQAKLINGLVGMKESFRQHHMLQHYLLFGNSDKSLYANTTTLLQPSASATSRAIATIIEKR